MPNTHTPGPWNLGSKDIADIGGFRVNRFAISGSGVAIASVWAGDPQKALAGVEHEGVANARLIAAAPELLTALSEVVRWLGNTGTLYSTDKLIPHLRAAIKNATE